MSKTKQKVEIADNAGVTHTLKVTIPDTWEVVPLKTVLEDIVGGGTPSRDNPSYWNGSIPWLTVKDMRTRRPEDSIDHISEVAVRDSATNIIPADTVIIATRIGLGKVIRVPYDAAINQDLKALITKPTVDKSYLEYWIYSIASYLESIGSGTTVKGIRLEHVRSLPFPLAPLDQQKRIVAEIEKQFSRLDEAVANLKRVKANLKRYKAAVLKAAVEGRLVETEAELARREGRSYETGEQLVRRILETRRSQWRGKGKYKEPAAPDTANLPPLPEGWTWATIDGLVREPLRNGHSAKATKTGRGLRAFTLSAITEGDFSEQNTKLTVASAAKVVDLWAQPGDIFIERSNTPELVGIARLYKGTPNFAFFPDLLIRVRTSALLDTRYLEICLLSESVRNYFRSRAQGISGTMPKIDQQTIELATIPLPPLAEQSRIINEVERRLSLVREVKAQVDTNLKRAERLRQSILSRAFSGQLFRYVVGIPGIPPSLPTKIRNQRTTA